MLIDEGVNIDVGANIDEGVNIDEGANITQWGPDSIPIYYNTVLIKIYFLNIKKAVSMNIIMCL